MKPKTMWQDLELYKYSRTVFLPLFQVVVKSSVYNVYDWQNVHFHHEWKLSSPLALFMFQHWLRLLHLLI